MKGKMVQDANQLVKACEELQTKRSSLGLEESDALGLFSAYPIQTLNRCVNCAPSLALTFLLCRTSPSESEETAFPLMPVKY